MAIGVHTSMASGLSAIPPFASELNCNAVQLFLHSPRQWLESKFTDEDVEGFKVGVQKEGIQVIVGHSSYFTNFAKPWAEAERAMKFLKFDLGVLARIGGHGLVTHIGKYLELDPDEAYRFTIENLNRVLEESAELGVPLYLEDGAGQGTEIGVRFDELARIYDGITPKNRERLFFCLDTCRSFAAGYDYRTPNDVADTFKAFDETIGIEHLKVIHLNDSKKPIGSRVDRHANLGEGEIGMAGIQAIVKKANALKIPMILETPNLYEDVLIFTARGPHG